MGLRIICGRAGTGKSHLCFKEIKERIDLSESDSIIYIVPEQFTFQSDIELARYLKNKGLLQAEVLSFQRLANKLAGEVGGIARKKVSETGKIMLLFDIVNNRSEDNVIFKDSAGKRGFIENISELITEFKRSGITPNDLTYSAGGGTDSINNGVLSLKTAELAEIYRKYLEIAGDDAYDFDDELTLLANNIKDSEYIAGSYIWIDEFRSFTESEKKIIKELIRYSKELTVTVVSDKTISPNETIGNYDIFYGPKTDNRELLRYSLENDMEYTVVDVNTELPPRFHEKSGLAALEKALSSKSCKSNSDIPEGIYIYRCRSVYEEVENIAKQIMDLVRHRNYRYNEIGLVSGEADEYTGMIASVFRAYEIPFFLDSRIPMRQNGFIIMLMSAFKILTEGWQYEDVFTYLRSGFCGFRDGDIDEMELYVKRYNINGIGRYKTEWNYPLDTLRPDKTTVGEGNQSAKLNELRIKLTTPLLSFWEKVKGGKNAEIISAAIYEFICDTPAAEIIKGERQEHIKNDFTQAWNAVIEILDQISDVFGGKKYTLTIVSKMMEISFASQTIGKIPFTKDAVMVGMPMRMRSRGIRALFVPGVNEGKFPRPPAEKSILNDNDRALLNNDNGLHLKTKDERIKEEQLSVYKTLTTPSEILLISYAISSVGGASLRPSSLISKLNSLFPNIQNITYNDDDTVLYPEKPAFNGLLLSSFFAVDPGENNSKERELHQWFLNNHPNELNALLAGYKRPGQEYIDSDISNLLYGKIIQTGITSLQKYIGCPFRYFMEFGLNVFNMPDYKMNKSEKGIIYHKVLEKYFADLRKESGLEHEITKEYSDQMINALCDDIFSADNGRRSDDPYYQYDEIVIKKMLRDTAWITFNNIREGDFEPALFEIGFGYKGGYRELHLHANGTEVILRGKIDRADIYKKDGKMYLRVVDYKSKNKKFNISKLYYGLDMQLLVYLKHLADELAVKNTEEVIPVGMMFQRVSNDLIKIERSSGDEKTDWERMKIYIPDGLVTDDPDVIAHMDKNPSSGKSKVIPVRYSSGGISGNIISQKGFDALNNRVTEIITSAAKEIKAGNCKIKPYKSGDETACGICDYRAVCKFGYGVGADDYNIIPKVKLSDISDNTEE